MLALGCILAELIILKPLIKGDSGSRDKNIRHGRDEPYQIIEIIKLIGSPTEADLQSIECLFEDSLKHQLRMLKNVKVPAVNLRRLFNEVGLLESGEQSLLDLIERLLVWDPSKRISAKEILKHPYLNQV